MVTYTFTIATDNPQSSRIYLDLTEFVREVTTGVRRNFGLMLATARTDEGVLHLPANVVRQFRDGAFLRVIHK